MSNEQHNTIDTVNETGQLNKLGFWVFLTAEIALFGTLFATFLVLQKSGSYGGASTPELFELPLVMIMTFLLLVSSYTCGIAVYFMRKENVKMMMIWMIITVLLGAGFVGFELYESSIRTEPFIYLRSCRRCSTLSSINAAHFISSVLIPSSIHTAAAAAMLHTLCAPSSFVCIFMRSPLQFSSKTLPLEDADIFSAYTSALLRMKRTALATSRAPSRCVYGLSL